MKRPSAVGGCDSVLYGVSAGGLYDVTTSEDDSDA
jgi:hypothetical protein